jgi:hypothetical protein
MGEPKYTHTPGPWNANTAGMIEDAEGHWIGDATTHVPICAEPKLACKCTPKPAEDTP